MSIKKNEVLFNENGWQLLNIYIKEKDYSKVVIILDKHIEKYCLSYFRTKVDFDYEVLSIPAGEEHKNIATTIKVWQAFSEMGLDRKSLVINLGGGMVTDLGGFAASTYKRGISFINIPTTLLAMVDASVGGKTGIDLDLVKNQIGTIVLPQMVIVDTFFLTSLPQNQLASGYAEMIKHSLIKDNAEWKRLTNTPFALGKDFDALIKSSIDVKEHIVNIDPLEHKERKTLNFGHTLGHAIESYFLDVHPENHLLHGEAIAIGMILAVYLSSEIIGLEKTKRDAITEYIFSVFPKQHFDQKDLSFIIDLTIFDKKNERGKVLFVLMKDFGNFISDCTVDNDVILRAFQYYSDF